MYAVFILFFFFVEINTKRLRAHNNILLFRPKRLRHLHNRRMLPKWYNIYMYKCNIILNFQHTHSIIIIIIIVLRLLTVIYSAVDHNVFSIYAYQERRFSIIYLCLTIFSFYLFLKVRVKKKFATQNRDVICVWACGFSLLQAYTNNNIILLKRPIDKPNV